VTLEKISRWQLEDHALTEDLRSTFRTKRLLFQVIGKALVAEEGVANGLMRVLVVTLPGLDCD
jgi:hypothetical protein